MVLPNLAIDSTLRSCDLVELKLGDVAHNGRAIPGKFLFFRPDCELLPEVPKPPLRVRDIEAIVAETGADVSAETSRSSWDGSAMDLDMAVGELMTLNGCEPRHHPWR